MAGRFVDGGFLAETEGNGSTRRQAAASRGCCRFELADGRLDLPSQVPGGVQDLYPHSKQKGVFLAVLVIPDDLSVHGEILAGMGHSYFEKTLLRRDGGRMKDMKALGLNDVCVERHSVPGEIVKLARQERGGRLRGGRRIDAELYREGQSASPGPAAFSSKPNHHPPFTWARSLARVQRTSGADAAGRSLSDGRATR